MRLRPLLPALFISLVFASSAGAQHYIESFGGGTSGTGVAFGSSLAPGRFLLNAGQESHLQAIVGDPKDTTNGNDAGAIFILRKPGSTTILLTIHGGQAGALYGSSVANLGDLDGDGYEEFAVGAPKQNSNGADAGSVFVYDGKTGNQIHKHDGDAAGDQLGFAIAGIGDADLDGIPDYVIAAPFNDAAGADAGRVKVISGANFSVMKVLNGDAAGDHFGTAVCFQYNMGNPPFTHTFAEFAVGAPNHNGNGVDSGQVKSFSSQTWATYTLLGTSAHQLFGSALSSVGYDATSVGQIQFIIGAPGDDQNGTNAGSATLVDSTTGLKLYKFVGGAPGDQLGAAVGYGGAYGFALGGGLILIGAPHHDAGSIPNAGAVHCYIRESKIHLWSVNGDMPNAKLGSCVGVWETTPGIAGPPPIQAYGVLGAPGISKAFSYTVQSTANDLHGEVPANLVGNGFGSAVARGGDVDNDGHPDVIVGSPSAFGNTNNAGRVDVISTTTGAKIQSLYGDEAGAAFGAAVAGAVDVDNDGRPDVIVGAPHHSNGSLANAGAPYVYSGKTGALIRSHFGSGANYQFGTAVCGAGDLDGDGFGDYVVGVPDADPNGADSGRVRVFSGQTGNVLHTWDGDAAGDHFGADVARINDIDGDGVDEIAVGAPDHVYSGPFGSTGFVRVFSGKTGAVLFTLHGSSTYRLGLSVASARDVDGDGVTDVIAGAQNQGTGVQLIDRGAVVVFSGATGNALHVIGGSAAYQHLGVSVAGLGDVNKNGFGEIAAGGLTDIPPFAGAGLVNLYDGTDGSLMYTLPGSDLGEHFGAAIAPAGDVGGDGVLDLIIGAPGVASSGLAGVGIAAIYDFSPVGLTIFGQGTPGCQGMETMYANTWPVAGNTNFHLTTIGSAPSSLSLGIVCNAPLANPADTLGVGILLDLDLFASPEIYSFDLPTDSQGRGTAAAPIPYNLDLVGKKYYGQVISYWGAGPCSPSPINLSSSFGLEIVIY